MTPSCAQPPDDEVSIGAAGPVGRAAAGLLAAAGAATSSRNASWPPTRSSPSTNAAYADLYAQLYSSGTAASLLDGIAAVVPSSDGLTEAELTEQADTLRMFIRERTDALRDQV